MDIAARTSWLRSEVDVAYALGKGIVLRPGTPEWTRELEERRLGVEVPRVMKRIWALLGRTR